MNEKLTYAQDVFLDKVNQICKKFGLNNLMAQLYAILYLTGKPMSLDDMVERLGISKGSASVNIRALERYGVVRKVWVKGSRKDFYEADGNISKVIMDRVKSMIKGRLSESEDMVTVSSRAINAVTSSDPEEAAAVEIFKERLEKLQKLQKKAQALFSLLDSSLLNGALDDKAGDTTGTNKEEIVVL